MPKMHKRRGRGGCNSWGRAKALILPSGEVQRPLDGPRIRGMITPGGVTDRVPPKVHCSCCGFVVFSTRLEPKCGRCMQADVFKEVSV